MSPVPLAQQRRFSRYGPGLGISVLMIHAEGLGELPRSLNASLDVETPPTICLVSLPRAGGVNAGNVLAGVDMPRAVYAVGHGQAPSREINATRHPRHRALLPDIPIRHPRRSVSNKARQLSTSLDATCPFSPAVGLPVERWARQRTSFRSGETREGPSRRIQILVYAKFIYVCLYLSVSTTVISVRIRKELKKKARELGIDIREVLERALEEAIRRREEEELVKALEELKNLFSRISEKEWVDAVRSSRHER